MYHYLQSLKAHLVLFIVLLLAFVTVSVNGFSSGAPAVACSNLIPLHLWNKPSSSLLPFTANTSDFVGQLYIPNQLYTSEYLATCTCMCSCV